MSIQRYSRASTYYWEFLKRFGEESYQSWRQEILAAFVVTLISYGLTRQDRGAWQITITALEANLILLSVFVVIHLVRTPYLLHRECAYPEQGRGKIVHGFFGLVGFVLLVAIVAATSYRLAKPSVPEVPTLTVTLKAPPAPKITLSQNQPAIGNSQGKPATSPPDGTSAPQSAPSSLALRPVVQPHAQPNQSTVPQTQLERVTETNKNLSAGDRNRLADAFFDYAQFLDQGRTLGYKANGELAPGSGVIANDVDSHIRSLHDIATQGKTYAKLFTQVRDKWKYYPDQTDYIFGDNPDNLGPATLINADGFAYYLEDWSKISNKNQGNVVNLIAAQQNVSRELLSHFMQWIAGCQQRLEQMKRSIQ